MMYRLYVNEMYDLFCIRTLYFLYCTGSSRGVERCINDNITIVGSYIENSSAGRWMFLVTFGLV